MLIALDKKGIQIKSPGCGWGLPGPSLLILKASTKICSRQQSKIFILFFLFVRENKSWYFMWIKQMIHMECQDLFSLKDKKKSKLSVAAVVIGTLRVKIYQTMSLLLGMSQITSVYFNSAIKGLNVDYLTGIIMICHWNFYPLIMYIYLQVLPGTLYSKCKVKWRFPYHGFKCMVSKGNQYLACYVSKVIFLPSKC